MWLPVNEYKNHVKSVQVQISALKRDQQQTRRQIRMDNEWDGEDANLSDKVSNWVNTYLFPQLKDGWMEYCEHRLSQG
jgi:hypothetical protein